MAAKAAETHRERVLKIDATLAVTVARGRITLDRARDLAPGTLLRFSAHHCDPVEVDVSGHAIARGGVVKVGDKFGIQITQMLQRSA